MGLGFRVESQFTYCTFILWSLDPKTQTFNPAHLMENEWENNNFNPMGIRSAIYHGKLAARWMYSTPRGGYIELHLNAPSFSRELVWEVEFWGWNFRLQSS